MNTIKLRKKKTETTYCSIQSFIVESLTCVYLFTKKYRKLKKMKSNYKKSVKGMSILKQEA